MKLNTMEIAIIYRRYASGTADLNRILAYAKSFASLGNQVKFYYLITQPDEQKHDENIPNVRFVYLWENMPQIIKKNKLACYIINLIRSRFLINRRDVLFLYEPNIYELRTLTIFRKGPVFFEFTEHPEVLTINKSPKAIKVRNKYTLNANGITVISKALYLYFSSIGVPKNKICISNMFVDNDRFQISKKSIGIDYIAYCGNISIYKDGVDDLIKAYSVFHQKYPLIKLYLIGGFDSESTKNVLIDLCKKYGIIGDVIFTGKISPNEIPQMLVNAKLLVLARPNNLQAQYGFPTKLGEYLATGVPVLVTDVGEISNFIHDKENGYIAIPDNPENLAEKMIYIFENYNEAIGVGNKGKLLSQREFSSIEQVRNVLAFFGNNIY